MSNGLDIFLKTVSGVDVSQNEIMYTHQFNRNLLKLLENDRQLDSMAQSILGSLSIKQWIQGTPYQYGDLVWYRGVSGDELHLLRSTEDNNYNRPAIELVDGKVDNQALNESGWNNQNRYLTLIELGLESLVKRRLNELL